MKITLALFLGFVFTCNAFAKPIIFPKNDPHSAEKIFAISEVSEIMGPSSSVDFILRSEKVLMWANATPELKLKDGSTLPANQWPSFIAASANNEEALRQEMEAQCECSLEGQPIAGILVANPYQAARMYFRAGWSERTAEEVDGIAPPIVIIYHEFSHARDYLQNADYFFDLASQADRRWKNKAEQSAVMQQNDFVITLAQKRKIFLDRRDSYGRNTLFTVNGLFDTQPNL